VLGGEGKVFCAGADIHWMSEAIDSTEQENVADAKAMAHMYQTIDTCPVPVVGRVQRAAFGGAIGLISGCDIVVAETGTRLCFSEVKLGILPAVISSFSMAKIGVSAARRYFLTAEVFLAENAPAGLLHEIVPPDQLDSTVDEILNHILANGPCALRETKKLIPQVAESSRAEAIELCARTIARVRVSKEGQAGLRAFLNKTDPPWRSQT
jgi:methylglutaconyl-CoA hydratase